jgi:hypothetical protein
LTELSTHCISNSDSSGDDKSYNLNLLLEDICREDPGSAVCEKESEIDL